MAFGSLASPCLMVSNLLLLSRRVPARLHLFFGPLVHQIPLSSLPIVWCSDGKPWAIADSGFENYSLAPIRHVLTSEASGVNRATVFHASFCDIDVSEHPGSRRTRTICAAAPR